MIREVMLTFQSPPQLLCEENVGQLAPAISSCRLVRLLPVQVIKVDCPICDTKRKISVSDRN